MRRVGISELQIDRKTAEEDGSVFPESLGCMRGALEGCPIIRNCPAFKDLRAFPMGLFVDLASPGEHLTAWTP